LETMEMIGTKVG